MNWSTPTGSGIKVRFSGSKVRAKPERAEAAGASHARVTVSIPRTGTRTWVTGKGAGRHTCRIQEMEGKGKYGQLQGFEIPDTV